LDDSVRAEVESVLGHDPLDNISPEGPQSYKEQSNVNDDITDDGKQSEDNKQTEDMLINAAGKQDVTFASCATADQLSKRTPTSQEPEKNPESQAHLTRNVTFAATIMKTATHNSHSLRGGNVKGTYKPIPDNPYTKPRSSDSGVLYPQPTPQKVIKTDKAIMLKKSALRPNVHRYTLRFETIKEKTEDEAQQLVKDALQRFFKIVLQADPKTIIPPYLELDRNDKSVSDLSSVFPVSSIDSFHVIKKYFFQLSQRDEAGNRWCSLILAQSLPFHSFMEQAKPSLENNNFSLWPKASDNENTTDVGWLLYSTRAQDKERLSVLLFQITGENLGVKWKPIRSSNSNMKRKDQSPKEEKSKHST
jgi:hypothetical protein